VSRRPGRSVRQVPAEVAEQIPVDKIVVFQQPDGMWRWRWLPASGSAEPLLAAHGFESASEAEESARSAYPETTRVVVEESRTPLLQGARHATRHGCLAALSAAVVLLLVAVRRHRTAD
jgi:hypothetical protein